MPTHENPDPVFASVLLGLTAGDSLRISLASQDYIAGTVQTTTGTRPGDHFDTPGSYHLEFDAAGVDFELTLRYEEANSGEAIARSIDFRLVEGHDWNIPVTPAITRITNA